MASPPSSEPAGSSGNGSDVDEDDTGPPVTAAPPPSSSASSSMSQRSPRYTALSTASAPRASGTPTVGGGGEEEWERHYTMGERWSRLMREQRHNPCLMKPATALLIFIIAVLSLIGLVFQLPVFLLGLVLSPLLRRGAWFVEFLYPSGVARYVHIALMKWGLQSKMGGGRGGKGVPPQHSRSVEQRTEVVKGRVYVHPLPQLLDNVGYLIVCCPPPGDDGDDAGGEPILGILVDCGDAESALAQVRQIRNAHYSAAPFPSSGNAGKRRPEIEIHAVLCTHKHHDHTAGNRALLADPTVSKTLTSVYGGAVEDVPYCTHPVTNGMRIPLPKVGNNDMAEIAEIECIAVPSHTRGSVVYALRNKKVDSAATSANANAAPMDERRQPRQRQQGKRQQRAESQQGIEEKPFDESYSSKPFDESLSKEKPFDESYAMEDPATLGGDIGGMGAVVCSHLFTGDAMFSGGGGVAFESDVESPKDKDVSRKTRNSLVKVTAGRNSIERCFAEVLVRSIGGGEGGSGEGEGKGEGSGTTILADAADTGRVMMFPGHEYTADLLLRQLDPSNEYHGQWTKLPPGVFFETASQYLVSSHRRTLPKNGRLLTVPSPLLRELKTNPHFRSLRKRGEHLLSAVRVWYRYVSRGRAEVRSSTHKVGGLMVQQSHSSTGGGGGGGIFRTVSSSSSSYKTPSTNTTWNMDHNDVNRSVFATVYASDLDAVIDDLQSGAIGAVTAARRLREMKSKLDEPVVSRRPIPGTLPSERNMYLGVVALALLGSPPCGMTQADGLEMNLPPPKVSSDEILISKRRLLAVLSLLGLLRRQQQEEGEEEEESYDMASLIDQLWKEAQIDYDYDGATAAAPELRSRGGNERINEKPPTKPYYNATDVEAAAASSPVSGRDDEIELGLLKLTLYGAALNQPSWFTKFCLPCGDGGSGGKATTETGTIEDRDAVSPTPATPKMRRSHGELVRHDITSCPMCRDVVGAPCAFSERLTTAVSEEGNDDDGADSVEDVYHHSVLMEGVGSAGDMNTERSDGVELQIVPSSL